MKDGATPSRAAVLHEVIEVILSRQDGRLPTDLDNVEIFFADAEDLISTVLLRWHTLLASRLEHAVADEPDDRAQSVIGAWRDAADDYRGVRLLIDQLSAHPPSTAVERAVRATSRHDWAAMAVCAGQASSFDPPAIRAGRQLELEARRLVPRDQPSRPHEFGKGITKLTLMLLGLNKHPPHNETDPVDPKSLNA